MCLAVLVCSCAGEGDGVAIPVPTSREEDEASQDMGSVQSEQVSEVERRGGRGLTGYEKQVLGLIYGEEVLDGVRVHVGQPQVLPADPMWGLIVRIAVRNGYGVSVGDDVYFPQELDTSEAWGMEWLGHELRHVEQYRQAGGVEEFGAAYVWYLVAGAVSLEAGSAYVNNPFENDARVYGDCVVELLGQRLELMEGLGLAGDKRDEYLGEQVGRYARQYKRIVQRCLGEAKRRPTTFKMDGDKSFTISFQLKGKFTGPVGGEIDLGFSENTK